jgi:hypothetical protein
MTREVLGYRIARADRINEFEEHVNDLLEQGYQPLNAEDGVVTNQDEFGDRFTMQMVLWSDSRMVVEREINIRHANRNPITTRDAREITNRMMADRGVEAVPTPDMPRTMVEPAPPTTHWTAHTESIFEDVEEEEIDENTMTDHQLNRLGVGGNTVHEATRPNETLIQAARQLRDAEEERGQATRLAGQAAGRAFRDMNEEVRVGMTFEEAQADTAVEAVPEPLPF